MAVFLIFLGGGIGSVARYALGRFIQGQSHSGFPIGTLAVNVIGCIAIGALARFFANTQTENAVRAMLIVGLCGGFTTFSTFSYETVGLMIGGKFGLAALYVGASVGACLVGTYIAFTRSPVTQG